MTTQELYEDIYKENFSFGKNWQDFLTKLDDSKIDTAKKYLIDFLGGIDKIQGKDIVDFGSGSWLMSLCFCLLWAQKVVSIDIDDDSVNCAIFLREKYAISPDIWVIKKWSVLDEVFIESLWKFDTVYSWWVIHHTGDMWRGLDNITKLCKRPWYLYIAIYNKSTLFLEGTSTFWLKLKKFYSSNHIFRPFIKVIYTLYLLLWITATGNNPIKYIQDYKKNALRWMDFFVDIEDWLGGYPYEYASHENIVQFYKEKGFILDKSTKVRSIGCNEFLFQNK